MMIILPVSVYAEGARLVFNDVGNDLSEQEFEEIKRFAEDAVSETGWNIAVEYDKDGYFEYEEDAFDYCVDSFENIFGDNATGVYYYFADHYTYLITSGDAQYYISKKEAGKTARLGDNSYKEGEIVRSAKEVIFGIRAQYQGGRDNPAGGHEDEIAARNGGIIVGVIIGAVSALIFFCIVHSSYKNKAVPSVSAYVNKSEGIKFPVQRDVFVRSYVTTHVESRSSGGGGGGFSSGGHTGGGGAR